MLELSHYPNTGQLRVYDIEAISLPKVRKAPTAPLTTRTPEKRATTTARNGFSTV